MRWRYTSRSKREYIVETTAWYDGVGYEYTIVDGGLYRECRGRIRLQEIAEGTIVRWTFNYEMKGVIGGLRNALNHRRALERDMIDSLKSLWRYMNQVESGSQEFEARSLMRDAPDYEARAQYKPRHPSMIQEQDSAEPNVPISPVLINEPPIQEEDTKPHGILPQSPPEDTPQTELVVESGGLEEKQPEQPASSQDQQEVEAVPSPSVTEPEEPLEAPTASSEPAISDAAPPPNVPSEVPTPEAPETAPRLTSITDTLPGTKAGAVPTQSLSERTTEQDIPRLDTREISVFELFGLPKPSETQEMQPVRLETQTADISVLPALIDPHAPTVVDHPLRIGLRLLLRRRHAKVRRPS